MKKFILPLIILSVVTGVAICFANTKQANSKLNALALANIEALTRGEAGNVNVYDRLGYSLTECKDKNDPTKTIGRRCKLLAPEYICDSRFQWGDCPGDENN